MPAGDPVAGEIVFWAGGCTSCHAAPKSSGDDKKILAGGLEFKTDFGVFRAPNISSDKKQGIGDWDQAAFANAMLYGTTPGGSHYYPAFPYTSYIRMSHQDLSNLWAYMQTLPASSNVVEAHDVGFPFNIRRGLGLWKLLYLSDEPILDVPADNDQLVRGRYLVEGLSHCGECHTPRNAIGGPDKSRWLAGGRAPEGNEKIPNIAPHGSFAEWSESDIVEVLTSGFTPEYDSVGSSMADVVTNTSKLPKSDREAIAAYLKAVKPPVQ